MARRGPLLGDKIVLARSLDCTVSYSQSDGITATESEILSLAETEKELMIVFKKNNTLWINGFLSEESKKAFDDVSEDDLKRIKRFIGLCEVESLMSDDTERDVFAFVKHYNLLNDDTTEILTRSTRRKWQYFAIGFSFTCSLEQAREGWNKTCSQMHWNVLRNAFHAFSKRRPIVR